jgi:hypothetical protein
VPATSELGQLLGHKQTTHGRCLHECSRPRSGLLKSVQETTAVVGADGSCGASLSGPRKGCSQRQQQELERVQSHDEPILPGSSAARAQCHQITGVSLSIASDAIPLKQQQRRKRMLAATVILLSLTFKSCRRKIVFEICRNKRYEKAIGRTPESSLVPAYA